MSGYPTAATRHGCPRAHAAKWKAFPACRAEMSMYSGLWPWLILLALCSALYLPGIASMPVTDRDEARFMQATRQMVESGDYVVVRFQNELRVRKPVGIYWLQSAAVRAFGGRAIDTAWTYRVPSLVAGFATVLLVFCFGSLLFDRRVALLAAAITASSLTLVAESHLATTDATLVALTTAATGSLGVAYVRARAGEPVPGWSPFVLWLCMGAGILVKGPVAPAVTLLTALALGVADRNFRWLRDLRPVLGLVLCGLVVVPWMAAVTSQTEGAFLSRAVREDLLPKLIGGHEGHGAPPGYFLLLAGLTLWPGSLVLWPALGQAWRKRALPRLRFLLAWTIPTWVMFELVPTKLPHYVLPVFPALALMIAAMLLSTYGRSDAQLSRPWPKAWYVAWSLYGLALAAALVLLSLRFGEGPSYWPAMAALGVVAAIGLAWLFIARRRFLEAVTGAMVGAAVTYISLFAGVLPSLSSLWVSERLVAAADRLSPGGRLAAVGYHEPSLVFLAGTHTRLTDSDGAATLLMSEPGAVAAVEARDLDSFRAALPSPGVVREATVIKGFDYSNGTPVAIHLFVEAQHGKIGATEPAPARTARQSQG